VEDVAGIVLAGGRSERMRRPKAELGWGGTSFAAHVAAVLREAVEGPVVVVRAQGQWLPELPPGTGVAEDAQAGRGPLEGIAAGMRAVERRAAAAFVSAVDVPFLEPAFVRTVVRALRAGCEAAVPRLGRRTYPLSAAYTLAALPVVEDLLARDVLRARSLVAELQVCWLSEAELLADPELAAADPRLESLANVNTASEYEAALRRRQESASRSGCA
jgi:molybdopterin-guanine dinucleotide biosynthesis protein A